MSAAPPVIGLTGGIGSGKTTVARLLAARGARVIDTDTIAHDAYRPGTDAHRRIVETFGSGVVAPDGAIDRKALGALVFGAPDQLVRLNAIVHPYVGEEVRRRMAAARADGGRAPIVLEVPLLVEVGWKPLVDRLWVVSVPREVAIERVAARSELPRAEIERRIDAQLPDAERRRHADLVIENAGTLDALAARVEEAWRTLGI
jgi:dephospho-CoA kinase